MARRRLALGPEAGAAAGSPAAPPAAAPRPGLLPPIAQVARETAAEAALGEVTERLRAAREGGALVLDLPLESIDPDHLARDRLEPPGSDPDFAGLRDSIRAHGQRVPVEVMPVEGGARPWGLLSGLRRLAALRELHAATGEPRFATVRALVRRPAGPAEAYVAMVEENELRAGLSYYERARLAAVTARLGVFPDEEAALRGLFAGASRARRSKIRSFLPVVRELGGSLRFPARIPERLGLRLAAALREGAGPRLRDGLAAAAPASPEAEQAALARLLRRPAPAAAEEELRPGLRLVLRRRGGAVLLRLEGAGEAEAAAARAALRAAFRRG